MTKIEIDLGDVEVGVKNPLLTPAGASKNVPVAYVGARGFVMSAAPSDPATDSSGSDSIFTAPGELEPNLTPALTSVPSKSKGPDGEFLPAVMFKGLVSVAESAKVAKIKARYQNIDAPQLIFARNKITMVPAYFAESLFQSPQLFVNPVDRETGEFLPDYVDWERIDDPEKVAREVIEKSLSDAREADAAARQGGAATAGKEGKGKGRGGKKRETKAERDKRLLKEAAAAVDEDAAAGDKEVGDDPFGEGESEEDGIESIPTRSG